MKIVFPMAGKGSRFKNLSDQNPEYLKPKPMIKINEKPLIVWARSSYPKDLIKPENLIFICLKEHQRDFQIDDFLKKYFGKEIKIIFLPEVTRGAAETALAAKSYLSEENVIFSDCDIFFNTSSLIERIQNRGKDVAGILPVVKTKKGELRWSFALSGENNRVLEVGEKDPKLANKGAFGIIGGYYFSSGNLFINEAEKMIAENDKSGTLGKEEFYFSQIYRRMIKSGKRIEMALTSEMWSLDTPKDVDYFLANFHGDLNYFNRKK